MGIRVAIIGSRGLTDSYGGIEKVLLEICPRLAELGHEIHVFGADVGQTAPLPPGVRNIPVPAVGGKYTETLSRTMLGIIRAWKGDYDVINLVAIGPGAMSFLARLSGKPVVVSIHGLDWARDKWPAPARFALRAAEKAIVLFANEMTVVSKQLVDYFKRTHDRDVIYTPNGVDLRDGPADGAILSQFGLVPGDYIFFASRLVEEKGGHELIEAFNRIETTKKLVIAGGDRYDKDYVARLKQMDRTGRVIFTGHVSGEPLDHLFRGAYLYVLPSHIEGLSLSLLEAMGYGKMTLVSDIPENLEVVGDCGFTFPVGNVDRLAEALQRIVCTPECEAEMGQQAAARARALFTWDGIAKRYSDAFELALARQPRGRIGLRASIWRTLTRRQVDGGI